MTTPSTTGPALPDDAMSYKRTASFTENSVPAALLGKHSTKAGAWGLIHVELGQLRYLVTDPRREPSEHILTPDTAPGVVEPTIVHHVELLGPVQFYVEFLRRDTELVSDGDPH